MKKNTEQDFWNRATPKETGCWEFESYADRDGYRFFTYEGKEYKAHRLAMIFKGFNPKGKVVMHHCDNPACVNPAHLEVATQKKNMQDYTAKGFNKGNRYSTKKGVTKEML